MLKNTTQYPVPSPHLRPKAKKETVRENVENAENIILKPKKKKKINSIIFWGVGNLKESMTRNIPN